MIGGRDSRSPIAGGDGNDVVLDATAPLTYFLAEGATGEFFDDDVLIANPNDDGRAGDDDVPAGGRRHGRGAAHDSARSRA